MDKGVRSREPAFRAAWQSPLGHFRLKTQEDQPAKVSDGFGQKVNDEEFVKVISAVGRKASQSGGVCRLDAVAAVASNIRYFGSAAMGDFGLHEPRPRVSIALLVKSPRLV